MSFDHLVRLPATPEQVQDAVSRTVRWAQRGLDERARLREQGRGGMALFGINQGGTDAAERARCFAQLGAMPFDGFALGGLWVGEDAARPRWSTRLWFPREKPRYPMGVVIRDVEAVARGVDMWLRVPTRNARRGTVFIGSGRLVVRNAAYAQDGVRSTPSAIARRAASTRALTCATCSYRARSSACGWRRCTPCIT
jgi:queuine tRNA-ribosyltransferase